MYAYIPSSKWYINIFVNDFFFYYFNKSHLIKQFYDDTSNISFKNVNIIFKNQLKYFMKEAL